MQKHLLVLSGTQGATIIPGWIKEPDTYNSSQQQYPQTNRGSNNFNPRNQRTRGGNFRGQRGAFYNPRNQYKGNYRYRYPNYRNQSNFQGSRYERQTYNRNPQMSALQLWYKYKTTEFQ